MPTKTISDEQSVTYTPYLLDAETVLETYIESTQHIRSFNDDGFFKLIPAECRDEMFMGKLENDAMTFIFKLRFE